MDLAQAEEHILDTPEQMKMFNDWLEKESQSRTIMFYYQDADYLPLEDCGRHMNGVKGQLVYFMEYSIAALLVVRMQLLH